MRKWGMFHCGRDWAADIGYRLFLGLGPKEPPEEGMLYTFAFAINIFLPPPVRIEWSYRAPCDHECIDSRKWTGIDRRIWSITTNWPRISIEIAHVVYSWSGFSLGRRWLLKHAP